MTEDLLKARNFLSFLLILALSLAMISMISCGKKEQSPTGQKKLNIVTTLFPLYDFTRNIVGDKAQVTLLLPPGIEPHSFEPKPGDMLRINSANLFIYTGKYMEPWVEGILKGLDSKKLFVVDTSRGIVLNEEKEDKKDHDDKHGRGKIDPHMWLDLSNAQKIVDNILDSVIQKDVANRDYYTKNAAAYKTKLSEMDAKFRETFSICKKHTFIHGGHFAFNYLAKRYNLQYIAAYHGSPDAEPTPRRLIELKNKMKQYDIKYIYYEGLILPRVSEVISQETGATMLKLHGAHNISKEDMEKGITFLVVMEENLKNLKVGLECQ
ncbi:MAG: zinc ABC transporter substrate-binding protein [Proteobacteria bacterium]|nr:zinc ABC transporter substrate-binding protein [Pseudomonadota bacterium]